MPRSCRVWINPTHRTHLRLKTRDFMHEGALVPSHALKMGWFD